MGFYFFSLIFLGKGLNSRFLYYSGLFLVVTLGGALSLTRILQGGHFFSDVLASAVIMWYTSWALYELFDVKREI